MSFLPLDVTNYPPAVPDDERSRTPPMLEVEERRTLRKRKRTTKGIAYEAEMEKKEELAWIRKHRLWWEEDEERGTWTKKARRR